MVGTRGSMSDQATTAAANTFPTTHVMILLYYANYAVPTHGQWCILMAIAAQRGAVTIDQSCLGYANSVRAGESESTTGSQETGAERTTRVREIFYDLASNRCRSEEKRIFYDYVNDKFGSGRMDEWFVTADRNSFLRVQYFHWH